MFVLDGLARHSRHVCAVFVLVLCPGSVLPQFRERLYRQWTRGRHGTSSGGCAAFLVNKNGVLFMCTCMYMYVPLHLKHMFKIISVTLLLDQTCHANIELHVYSLHGINVQVFDSMSCKNKIVVMLL